MLAEGDHPPREEVQDQVTIQMPAEGAYLSVLRTATALREVMAAGSCLQPTVHTGCS